MAKFVVIALPLLTQLVRALHFPRKWISFPKIHVLFSTLTSPISCNCTHLSLSPLYHPIPALQYPLGSQSHSISSSTTRFHALPPVTPASLQLQPS